ncbi:MAG: ABC transporter ATP-binding protein [bacterium]|nr:ABC transporter ATP-binding protein [bacterium]
MNTTNQKTNFLTAVGGPRSAVVSILEARGLTKSFGEIKAVQGVDLKVEPGEILGLVGPDGAGKSTLLRLLVGVLDPDAGYAAVGGIKVGENPEGARELLGYMPQQYSLYADLTVSENIRFFADMYFVPPAERERRLERLFEFSRLKPYVSRPAGKLSGGMYKKLALSCSLIHTPKLLILDEPTTGVDPLSRRELWDILYAFSAEGVAIVVSTPYMDEAERCHRVSLIHQGRILVTDHPSAILGRFRDELFEVETENLEKARAALSGVTGIRRCYPSGSVLKAAAAEGSGGETLIRRALEERAAPFASVAKIEPNFEDVFLSLEESF